MYHLDLQEMQWLLNKRASNVVLPKADNILRKFVEEQRAEEEERLRQIELAK
jgi:hypothetical protein